MLVQTYLEHFVGTVELPIERTPDLEESIRRAHLSFEFARAKGLNRWVLMYSGGKDSTAVLVLALEWSKKESFPEEIHVIYGDTGVEIPTLHRHAESFLKELDVADNVYIHWLRPEPAESFWTLVIGKGYPPPHQRFRWCTDKLKIKPARKIIKQLSLRGPVAVFTGVRFGESDLRDRRMSQVCGRGGECGHGVWMEEASKLGVTYLAPIAFWRECQVWDYLNFIAPSLGYPTHRLADVYGNRDTRFGCWICTVVRQDRTMQHIVNTPEGSMWRPLMEFRNWLASFALNPTNRVKRPNGANGRLTLAARKEILKRVKDLEKAIGINILSSEELRQIEAYWQDPKYADEYSR